MNVRFSSRAAFELREILDYLNAQNPRAAKIVRASIARALGVIRSFPAVGILHRRGVRRYVVPQYPYLIYYSVAAGEQEIRIITVRRAGRRPFLTA